MDLKEVINELLVATWHPIHNSNNDEHDPQNETFYC